MTSADRLYLKYLARHKWFVFRAGLKTRAPLWRLIIHDWSKFLPSEWVPYRDYFYGEKPETGRDMSARRVAFNEAWNHHQKRNKHHWQYWLLTLDSGETFPVEMPEIYIREMVADWMGAGRAIVGKKSNTRDWYLKNESNIKLAPTTHSLVEEVLNVIALTSAG